VAEVASERERDRLLEQLFQIHPGELSQTLILFTHFFCAVGAVSSGRTVRDALFLGHFDKSALAWVYIAQALLVALIGTVYARFADRVAKDRLAANTATFLGVSLCAFYLALPHVGGWLVGVLYVWIEVVSSISVMQFWSLASEQFNPREAKRLFGVVGAGGTLATILLGLVLGPMAKSFGASSLLVLCAALLWATVPLARATGARGRQKGVAGRPRQAPAPQRAGAQGSVWKLVNQGHLRLLAATGMLTLLTTTLVDYQWKSIAKEHYPHPDELTAYFAGFYSFCGLLSLGMQLWGTSRILSRFGVGTALSLLPVGLSVGTSVLTGSPSSLFAATWAKGADNVLRYTISDATTQLLYLPVPASQRGSAKAAIDGVLRPLAIALAGGLLLLDKQLHLGTPAIAVVTLVLIGGWLLVLGGLRRQYVGSLQQTLKRRVLDADLPDGALDGEADLVLRKALESPQPGVVLHALELLGQSPTAHLDADLLTLLRHPAPAVRRTAATRLLHRPPARLAEALVPLLADPDAAVRAAALEAYAATAAGHGVERLTAALGDLDPQVRAAAMAALLQHGDLGPLRQASGALLDLVESPSPLERVQAARVLGRMRSTRFSPQVLALLEDPDLSVQRAATEAAGLLQSPELLAALVQRLGDARRAASATEALAVYGDGAVDALARALSDGSRLLAQQNAPRALAAIATPRAMAALVAQLQVPDEGLRGRVAQAVRRAGRRNPTLPVDGEALRRAVQLEVELAYASLARAEVLAPTDPTPSLQALLATAVRERQDAALARVFALLTELYPSSGIELVYASLRDAVGAEAARVRANAVELLDNTLSRELKRALLPLLDDGPPAQKLRGAPMPVPRPASAEAALRELLEGAPPWVQAVACLRARELGLQDVAPQLSALAASDWPVLREAAVRAQEGLSGGGAGPDHPPRSAMLTTVEKVLFLKSIDLFSQIPGEALAQVALIASEEEHEAQEVLFREGDAGDALYLVLEGKVRVHREETTIAELGERECFGEMALLDASPRSATVTTQAEVVLLRIGREAFEELLQDQHTIARAIIQVLVRRLRGAIGRAPGLSLSAPR
jgi:ATP/ADP translocase